MELNLEQSKKCASALPKSWSQINWRNAFMEVRTIQARIVQAQKERKYNKVKSLQFILTRSFYAKAIAVNWVTKNSGKGTSGVDGILWKTDTQKFKAIHGLRANGYRSKPLKRVYIDKSNGNKRPLGIPTMQDRAMQALYLLALNPIAEVTGDPNSYGFRPKRSAQDAIAKTFQVLCKKNAPQWVLEGDIKACFDNISHEWIMENTPLPKQILKQWLKSGFYDKNVFHKTVTGTPQGGIISPVLANLALDSLETFIYQKLKVRRTPSGKMMNNVHRVYFVRYADDFLVTGNSQEILHDIKNLIEDFVSVRGMKLSEEKTLVTHVNKGFDFLGTNVRKYNGKLLIKPSRKNFGSIKVKIRETIRKNVGSKTEDMIHLLNPIIRGWVNYHSSIVAKHHYSLLDHYIWQCLWRWAKHRHPMKTSKWIRKRYFMRLGSRNWIFSASFVNNNDKRIILKLFVASDMPIKRHVKIVSEANPFDLAWHNYFAKREILMRLRRNETKEKLKSLSGGNYIVLKSAKPFAQIE
jgi:RNA-directed DNA polymerase